MQAVGYVNTHMLLRSHGAHNVLKLLVPTTQIKIIDMWQVLEAVVWGCRNRGSLAGQLASLRTTGSIWPNTCHRSLTQVQLVSSAQSCASK